MSAPASTPTPSDSGPAIDAVLERAALYHLLAAALWTPEEEALASLACLPCDGRRASPDDVDRVGHAAAALVEASRGPASPELRREHDRLFGHTAQGLVSPYETEYGPSDAFRQAEEIADVGGFYRAFGLRVAPPGRERQDHIALELEFLSFLACKEAYELNAGRVECLEAARDAQRQFLRDHVGRFGRAFARSLVKEARHPFYRAVGELCAEVLSRDAAVFGVTLGPELLPVRVLAEDRTPMACGGCALSAMAAGGTGEDAADAEA